MFRLVHVDFFLFQRENKKQGVLKLAQNTRLCFVLFHLITKTFLLIQQGIHVFDIIYKITTVKVTKCTLLKSVYMALHKLGFLGYGKNIRKIYFYSLGRQRKSPF